jgi:hypothetical protein
MDIKKPEGVDTDISKSKEGSVLDKVIEALTTPCCNLQSNSNTNVDDMSSNGDNTDKNDSEELTDIVTEHDVKDLDDELAKMDIDNDFTLSLSFVGVKSEEGEQHDQQHDHDNDDNDNNEDNNDTNNSDDNRVNNVMDCSNPEFATSQLNRMEVYSHLYKPNRDEISVLQSLATRLGVKTNSAFGGGTSAAGSNVATLANLLNVKPPNQNDADYMGKSIVLKRGPVKVGDQDRELILLTHGFILAYPEEKPLSSAFNIFTSPKLYDHVALYNDVDHVKDMWQLSSRHRFDVHIPVIGGIGDLYMDVDSAETKQSWLHAWERVLLRNRAQPKMQRLKAASAQEEREARIIGWQHELIQTSLYTAAVTGQAFFSKQHLKRVNELDEYNGMAPLHYAALHNQAHIIEHLCADCGANVELKDVEGRTPMYYGTLCLLSSFPMPLS